MSPLWRWVNRRKRLPWTAAKRGPSVREIEAPLDAIKPDRQGCLSRDSRQNTLNKPGHMYLDRPKLTLDAGKPFIMIRKLGLCQLKVCKDRFVCDIFGHRFDLLSRPAPDEVTFDSKRNMRREQTCWRGHPRRRLASAGSRWPRRRQRWS